VVDVAGARPGLPSLTARQGGTSRFGLGVQGAAWLAFWANNFLARAPAGSDGRPPTGDVRRRRAAAPRLPQEPIL